MKGKTNPVAQKKETLPKFWCQKCGARSGKTAIDNSVANEKRAERNQLLKDSDWTQLADKAGLADSKVTEWTTYRQSLRDLPTASGWPYTHTMPTEPS